jgi:hypothetical protein
MINKKRQQIEWLIDLLSLIEGVAKLRNIKCNDILHALQ